jgi:hypothetical protein
MVEIIPQKPKIAFAAWRWPLWVALGLFGASVIVFFGFKIYLSRLESEIMEVNNQIRAEAAKVSAEDENTVLRLNDSLTAFNNLVSNHSYFSEILNLVGSLTHSRVVFTKFDGDRERGFLGLRGTAQSYTVLAKQMVALRENKYVKSLDVRGISFGAAGGVEFELSMSVDPQVFIKK